VTPGGNFLNFYKILILKQQKNVLELIGTESVINQDEAREASTSHVTFHKYEQPHFKPF